MLVNRLIIFWVCALVFLRTEAQTHFNIRSKWSGVAVLMFGVTLKDQSAVAYASISENRLPYVPADQSVIIESGNSTFSQHICMYYDTFSDVMPYKIIQINDTAFVAFGGIRGDGVKPYYMRMDTFFDSKIIQYYSDTLAQTYFIDGVRFDESNTLALNKFQYYSTGEMRTYIYKIGIDGNVIYKKYYPQTIGHFFEPEHISKYRNGYVFTGTLRYNIPQSTYVAPKFVVIDTAGNVEKEWLLGQDIEGVKGLVVNDSDSSIVYCSNKFVSNNPAPKYNPYLSKLDGNGNVKWEKLIGVPFYETPLQTVIRLKDGNYITIGTAPHDFNDNGVNQPYMAGWIVKFADMGDSAHVLWERKYRGANSGNSVNILHDIVEKANGNLVAVGESTQSDSLYPQQGWILGLDSFGCLVPGCQDWTAINDKVIETTPLLRLYPNPMQDALYFDVQGVEEKRSFQMQITDIDGRELLQTMVSRQVQYSLDTKEYSSGSYIITLTENGKVVEKRKVVKQ